MFYLPKYIIKQILILRIYIFGRKFQSYGLYSHNQYFLFEKEIFIFTYFCFSDLTDDFGICKQMKYNTLQKFMLKLQLFLLVLCVIKLLKAIKI